MKHFSITITIIALTALHMCQSVPISLTAFFQKRQTAWPDAAQIVASREDQGPSSSFSDILTARFSDSSDNDTAPTNTTSSPEPYPTTKSPDNDTDPTNTTSSSQQYPTSKSPAASSPDQTYVIEDGDRFNSIAADFRTTVAALEAANPEVSPDDLQVGEEILIPGTFGGSGNGTAIGQPAPLNGTEGTSGSDNVTSTGNETSSDQGSGNDKTPSPDDWDIIGWFKRN